MQISVAIIKPKNKDIDYYMLHRMSCFQFENSIGNTGCELKTSVYANSDLVGAISQGYFHVPMTAMPSEDVLMHYVENEYTVYDDESWDLMNNGDNEVVNLTIVWKITNRVYIK